MQNQEVFNQISKIDTSLIKDSSLKNTLYLSLNLVENLQQEIIELKKTNQFLRDEINRISGFICADRYYRVSCLWKK